MDKVRHVGIHTIATQQGKLTAADGAEFDTFGWSVDIDGDTAIVGSFRDDDE